MAKVSPSSSVADDPLASATNHLEEGNSDVLDEAEAMLATPEKHLRADRLTAGTAGVTSNRGSTGARRSSIASTATRKSIVRVSTSEDELTEPLETMMRQLEQTTPDSSVLPDASTLRKDVARLNARLSRANAFLLNPRSPMMQRWDFVTLSALFFTATVTPYEVCMMWGDTEMDTLFWTNQLINGIFIVDIIFNFLLPYTESIRLGGGTVKDHRKIARRYIRSWFFLDIISVFPVDVLMVLGVLGGSAEADGESGAGATDLLQMVRMLRLLRLIKLARILRASRIFSRWENSISLSYASMSLIKWTVTIAIVLHWMACSLGLIAQLHQTLRNEATSAEVEFRVQQQQGSGGGLGGGECYGCVYGDYGDQVGMRSYCKSGCLTPCEFDARVTTDLPNAYDGERELHLAWLVKQESWICRYQSVGTVRPPEWHGEVWVAAVYISLIQLGGGVGSIVPENLAEYLLFVINILLGSVLWAMVVGTICGITATGDPHTIAFQQNMDALNYFLSDMNMPVDLCIRAREYLRNTRDLAKRSSYNELIERLSPALRADVVLHMSRQLLETVWYLADLEKGALVEISLKIERGGYAPREKVPALKLNILMRGVAAKAGNILTYGAHWGDDIIVSSQALRDLRPASALTYVEVATLSRTDLDEVLRRFPASLQQIRQAAMRVAMRRAVVIISEYVRSRRELRASGGLALRSNLMSAFGHDSEATDPTTVLRIITGKNLRDVDEEGYLVEEIDLPELEGEAKVLKMLEDNVVDRAAMRRELATVKSDVAEMKQMMKALLPQ